MIANELRDEFSHLTDIQLDDYILESILSVISNKDEHVSDIEASYAFDFISKKIEYLHSLQDSFRLKDNHNRFASIENYLDMLTLQEYNPILLESFAIEVSATLDILYSTAKILTQQYKL